MQNNYFIEITERFIHPFFKASVWEWVEDFFQNHFWGNSSLTIPRKRRGKEGVKFGSIIIETFFDAQKLFSSFFFPFPTKVDNLGFDNLQT